jgi:hypothetical protein
MISCAAIANLAVKAFAANSLTDVAIYPDFQKVSRYRGHPAPLITLLTIRTDEPEFYSGE